MEIIEDTPLANRHKLQWILYILIGTLFLYGLFLPKNWQEVFGPLSWPIQWAAVHIPSIRTLAPTHSAPELINGFLGLAAYIPPIFALCFAWYGFFDRTDPNTLRFISGKKGVCRIFGEAPSSQEYLKSMTSSKILQGVGLARHYDMRLVHKLIYFLLMVFFIYIAYFFSIDISSLDNSSVEDSSIKLSGEDISILEYVFCIFIGSISTGTFALVVVNLIAFIVDIFIVYIFFPKKMQN